MNDHVAGKLPFRVLFFGVFVVLLCGLQCVNEGRLEGNKQEKTHCMKLFPQPLQRNMLACGDVEGESRFHPVRRTQEEQQHFKQATLWTSSQWPEPASNLTAIIPID